MDSKEFIHKRICIYAGKDIDPNSDEQVGDFLRSKFNIHLPPLCQKVLRGQMLKDF